MDYLKSFPALEGLVELGELDNVDVNPTLLRVLTDLYVTKARHTADEERQYTELALRLIDVVDVPVRRRLAERLATYAAAPAPVMERLARDVIAVAEPVLRRSRALSRDEKFRIARVAGREHLAVLGAGEDSTPAPSIPVPIDALFAGSIAMAGELNELFFLVGTEERRLILQHLDGASFAPAKVISTQIAHEAVRRLEQAALSHNLENFVRELARALTISHWQARRIANDPSGEPVVVAAKALSMPAEVLQRVLLCLNPSVGQSVQRVYELADLYEALKAEAALRLLAIWQAMARKRPLAALQPYYAEDKTRRRPDAAMPQRRNEISKPPQRRSGTRQD